MEKTNVHSNWPICFLSEVPEEMLCKSKRELIFSAVILFNLHIGRITNHHNAINFFIFFLFFLKALIRRQIPIPFLANMLFLVVSQAACASCTNMGRRFYLDIVLMFKT